MLGRLVESSVRPREWHVVFRRWSPVRAVRILAFGTYKHVACFGYVGDAKSWLFFEPSFDRVDLRVVPDADANGAIADVIDGATVVRMAAPTAAVADWRPVFLCTQAVARVVGLRSCALRPDALLRDCIRQGAEIVIP